MFVYGFNYLSIKMIIIVYFNYSQNSKSSEEIFKTFRIHFVINNKMTNTSLLFDKKNLRNIEIKFFKLI